MGDIASSAARDPDFGENLGAFFEDEDLFGAVLGCGDGAEEARRSAADDEEIVKVRSHFGENEIANRLNCQLWIFFVLGKIWIFIG